MTNIIKLRFIRHGQPQGAEYTYYIPVDVAVGDIVEMEGKYGIAQGMVTRIDVPEAEMEPFKDRAKTIIGKLANEPEKEGRA